MLTHLSLTVNGNQSSNRLNVGIDMGRRKWAVNVLDTATGRHHGHMFTGPDCARNTYELIRNLKLNGREVDVIYEAGRNGFTPARELAALGADVTVLPVNKLEVVKAGKKAKTDGLDAYTMSERDARAAGFPRVWVPPVEHEVRRRMTRERDRLLEDIKRNNNRILSILERWPVGYSGGHRAASAWRVEIKIWRRSEAIPGRLPEGECRCIEAMVREIGTLEKNLAAWEKRIDAELARERQQAKELGIPCAPDILMQYKGIGRLFAVGLCWYVGDFSRIRNGRKMASLLGLVPMPWDSGTKTRCQGISKAGPSDIRRLMIQIAWLWSRHQPDSPITRKWQAKLLQKGAVRRKAIVAMARQLSVAFLRLINENIELEGAIKNLPLALSPARPHPPMAGMVHTGD